MFEENWRFCNARKLCHFALKSGIAGVKFINAYRHLLWQIFSCCAYSNICGFGVRGSGEAGESENLIEMKRALLLQPKSISKWNLKVLKRPKTIKDNICGFKKSHYLQWLVLHGKLSVKRPANFQTGFKFLTHVESDLESSLSRQHVFTPAYTI